MMADENGLWRQGAGPTVFATFESETDYFGSRAQQTMLNFRVRDLDAMLAQLRGSPPDPIFTRAVTCRRPIRLPEFRQVRLGFGASLARLPWPLGVGGSPWNRNYQPPRPARAGCSPLVAVRHAET
jgi:hypothetical protein